MDWLDYSQKCCIRGADKCAVLHAVFSEGLNLFLGAGASEGAINIKCLTSGAGADAVNSFFTGAGAGAAVV